MRRLEVGQAVVDVAEHRRYGTRAHNIAALILLSDAH